MAKKDRIEQFYIIPLLLCEGGPATYINDKFFQNYTCYLNIFNSKSKYIVENHRKRYKYVGSTVRMFHCDASSREKKEEQITNSMDSHLSTLLQMCTWDTEYRILSSLSLCYVQYWYCNADVIKYAKSQDLVTVPPSPTEGVKLV